MAFRREGYRAARLSSTNPYHTRHISNPSHIHSHSHPSLSFHHPSLSNHHSNSSLSSSSSSSHHRYIRHSEPDGPINEYGIYCGNLAWDVTSEMLKEHLSQIGTVVSCEVFLNFDGRSKGSALARFESKESATRAIHELNDTDFRGRLIQVNNLLFLVFFCSFFTIIFFYYYILSLLLSLLLSLFILLIT